MPRDSQHLHPRRPPVTPLQAATVLLLRDAPAPDGAGASTLQVLMTRRSATASFVPGAYVFPGGGIEAQDAAPESHALADHRPAQAGERLTEALAALRESFEELGILLARRADGRWAGPEDIAALDRKAPFAAQVAARGLRLAADAMYPLAHWTADRNLPKRFAVPFLVARMPPGQEPVADESEQFEPVWVSPADALARHEAGQFFMIYPTIRTLERLAQYADVQAVLDAVAHEQPLWVSSPRSGLLAGKEARYMEHEAPFGELALVCPDGLGQHVLDWQCERPVPLLKNVQRLTAPNPGVMTGPGTNSYLVGEPATGYIAIDPGPQDGEHLERLWRAAGGDIRAIVCTHSHADHSPGAAPLQALVVAHGRAAPPVLGLPSAPTARAASHFVPDRALSDGELLTLTGQGLEGEITHTLEVVHTPGHAANHLCLILREDGLLFSGDHILNGSTTIIDPPDGNMAHYLDSLARLDALCVQHGVEFIAPAHGYVLYDARGAIAHLTAHRLAREAKVLAAMQARPDGSMEDWTRLAYADVPPRMWPLAQRSLLAHVERIRMLEPGNNQASL
ncbi:MAG TPA: MBL fold metallo-hydrolase [Comamonadaceae bacterium]|uniref:MBL fold metallo-hydrolase n=1 Tax=Pulveribacter sp. TaxID=2678893 RepID=UPI000EE8473C|nr:MBL fold metallo-hydrolase [Pulveribacter sp.]HCL87625.1 MBL fold metallo-hydrolase [Comamonadaceae bacterium]